MIADHHLPDQTPNSTGFLSQQTVERHIEFFLPYLRPGMHILDCGCGPGARALELAKRVGAGEVVGVDPERSLVELARRNAAERGVSNVQFRTARLTDFPFSDGIFDAVLAHAVLERLTDPLALSRALHEARRVLRPGGVLGIRSLDWGGLLAAPGNPELELALAHHQRKQIEQGANPYLGRQLRGLLRSAGFTAIQVSAGYECYEDTTPIAEYLARQLNSTADPVDPDAEDVEGQLAPNRHAEALRAWSRHPDAFFALSWCEAVGRKAQDSERGGPSEPLIILSEL